MRKHQTQTKTNHRRGIAALEDKVVQHAVGTILSHI
jgi:hypothetical protein